MLLKRIYNLVGSSGQSGGMFACQTAHGVAVSERKTSGVARIICAAVELAAQISNAV